MSGLITGIAGVAISAVTAGVSLSQSNKQKKIAKDARRRAESSLADAYKRMEVNPYRELSVDLSAIQESRDQMRQIVGNIDSDADQRSVGVQAGRAGALSSLEEDKLRQSAIAQKQAIDQKVAGGEETIRDTLATLDVSQAKQGFDTAAAAEEAAVALKNQAIQGFADAASTGIGLIPRTGFAANRGLSKLEKAAGAGTAGSLTDYMQNIAAQSASGNTLGLQQQNPILFQQLQNQAFADQFQQLYGGTTPPTAQQQQEFMFSYFNPQQLMQMSKYQY